MRKRSFVTLFGGTAALTLSIVPACFGACPDEIDRMQARLDARIASVFDTARFTRDARRALGLPAPPRSSLVTPQDTRGGDTWMAEAVAGIARAREANSAGDAAACEQALVEVRGALDR